MKKKILIGSVVALLAVAAIPIALYAGGHGGGRGCHKGMGFAKLHDIKGELDLTKAQEEQIHSIMREVKKSNEQQLEAIHENMKKVVKVIAANPSAVVEARAVLASQAASEQQVKLNILDGVARASEVLTADQRRKLVAALD